MADPAEYQVGIVTAADEADMARYSPEDRALIEGIDAQVREQFRHYTEDFTHTIELDADGNKLVHNFDKEGYPVSGWHGPITSYFSLSYASWLVLPRLTLQEMPLSWQARFVALLEEAERMGVLHRPETKVTVIGSDGKYRNGEHWHNYRRGAVVDALATDRRLDAETEANKKARQAARLAETERLIAEHNAEVLA